MHLNPLPLPLSMLVAWKACSRESLTEVELVTENNGEGLTSV